VEDVILAGDVDVGDAIVLPDADDAVLVSRVRLGAGRAHLHGDPGQR
jgi:hypothetical protein